MYNINIYKVHILFYYKYFYKQTKNVNILILNYFYLFYILVNTVNFGGEKSDNLGIWNNIYINAGLKKTKLP